MSAGASALLVSGSILSVFTAAFLYGGKHYRPFLLTYSFMLLLVFLSQLAFIARYIKKDNYKTMQWDLIRKQAPAIVDLVEHRTHLFRSFTICLMLLEVVALFLAVVLSWNIVNETYDDVLDAEEMEDLLNRNRRTENYENAKRKRKQKMQRLREMREKFDEL